MNIPDNIFEKVKKLLRWAESKSKSGDPIDLEQAQTATAQANKMLLEYNMSIRDVDLKDKPKMQTSKVNDRSVPYYERGEDWQEKNFMPKNEGKWLIQLYFCICEHNFCRGISHGRYNFSILGEPHNIEVVKFICDQLEQRLRILARQAYKRYKETDRYGWENKNAFIRGYLTGAVEGIDDKLMQQRSKNFQEIPGSKALVHQKDAELIKYEEQEFPQTKSFKRTRSYAHTGKTMGYEDGNKIEIHKGLENNSLNQKMIG